jgi:S-DNA-T family DNA segregation ATPase FtsK/SpoIIIE
MLFGAASVLLLPLLFVFARRLWEAAGDLIDADEDEDPTSDRAGCGRPAC